MAATGFASNAEEIKHYIMELLDDQQSHSTQEIRDYVARHAPNPGRFTTGMYSGAIYSLVKNSNGAYVSTARGRYRKAGGGADSYVSGSAGPPDSSASRQQPLKDRVLAAIESSQQALRRACTANIMELEQSELEIAAIVSRLNGQLEQAKNEIRST